MSLAVEPLHPLFAAEVRGVQVCEPMDDATFAFIRDAFEEHSVLVFRDQRLSDDGHVAFSRRFGPLERTVKGNQAAGTHFARQSNLDIESGEVLPEGDRRLTYTKAARLWHTDSSFKPVPALCSLLAGHIVPPEGADTQFATGRAAWKDLDPAMRARVAGTTAIHSQMHTLALIDPSLVTQEMRDEIPPVEQPMVRINPVHGRCALYAGVHAFAVKGMREDEGRAFIAALNEHATQPKYVYSHRWRANDLVLWDNRATLHRATPYDAARYKRLLQRTTVAGDAESYRREREAIARLAAEQTANA